MDAPLVDAVIEDWRSAPVDDRLRAAFGLLEPLALEPWTVGSEHVAPLRTAGLDNEGIEDVIAVGSIFAVLVRIADPFGFEAPAGYTPSALRRFLRAGYDKRDVVGPAFPRHTAGFDALEAAVLVDGLCASTDLRRQLVEHTAGYVNNRDQHELPDSVAAFVHKQLRHAYRITDEDVNGLTASGFDGEEVFDIIVAVAVGSAVARQRLAMALLED